MVKMLPIPNMHRELRINVIKNFSMLFTGVADDTEIGTITVERDVDGRVTTVQEPTNTITIVRTTKGDIDYIETVYAEQKVRETVIRDEQGEVINVERSVY